MDQGERALSAGASGGHPLTWTIVVNLSQVLVCQETMKVKTTGQYPIGSEATQE